MPKSDKKISISITKKQYLQIYRAIGLFETLQNWHNNETGDQLTNFWQDLAEKFDLDPIDDPQNLPQWSNKAFKEIETTIGNFRDDSFWEEFAVRLSQLIYEKLYNKADHTPEEQYIVIEQIEKRVWQELEENGIENVKIKEII